MEAYMTSDSESQQSALGFTRYHIFDRDNQQGEISRIAWAADGEILASLSDDFVVQLWKSKTGELYKTFEENFTLCHCMAWSPIKPILALGSSSSITLIDA